MTDAGTGTNIYHRLARARAALRRQTIRPTGVNAFTKFNYFEMSDFLPQALGALDAEGLTPVVSYSADHATLTISDGEESIAFSTPSAAVEMKGCQPIQSLGAQQTYLRRYLYITAMEITEHDALDENAGGPLLQRADADKPTKARPAPTAAPTNGGGRARGGAKPGSRSGARSVLDAFRQQWAEVTMADLECVASDDPDYPAQSDYWQEPELKRLRGALSRLKGGESPQSVFNLEPGAVEGDAR
jgi:hypothetical protein